MGSHELPLNAPRDGSYVRALDGVRGVAILLVLVYHFAWTFPDDTPLLEASKRALWFGWVGVDLFFALSGFLITQRLLAGADQPLGVALRQFWWKRALRIFPLYYAVLALGSLLAWVFGGTVAGPSYWLYLQNYSIPFVPFETTLWTSHLWSLAVEEQFYLSWPLFFFLLPAARRPKVALGLCALTVLARALFALTPHDLTPDTTLQMTYAALPFRADALLLGSLGALLVREAPASLRRWQQTPGWVLRLGVPTLLVLIAWTRGFNQYDRRVQVLGYLVLGAVFAAAVVHVARGQLPAWARRALESRPLVALGRVSYGAYLFHWPLVVLAIDPVERWQAALGPSARVLLALALIPIGVTLTWLLSEISYRLFESPLLRLKHHASPLTLAPERPEP